MKTKEINYSDEFKCIKCGKSFKLERLHYFGDDERLCDDCFSKYLKYPKAISVKAFSKLKDD